MGRFVIAALRPEPGLQPRSHAVAEFGALRF